MLAGFFRDGTIISVHDIQQLLEDAPLEKKYPNYPSVDPAVGRQCDGINQRLHPKTGN